MCQTNNAVYVIIADEKATGSPCAVKYNCMSLVVFV
jgi:hypothetical protein